MKLHSILPYFFNFLNKEMAHDSSTSRNYSVASIIRLVEDDKFDELCCDGSDDEVFDLEM